MNKVTSIADAVGHMDFVSFHKALFITAAALTSFYLQVFGQFGAPHAMTSSKIILAAHVICLECRAAVYLWMDEQQCYAIISAEFYVLLLHYISNRYYVGNGGLGSCILAWTLTVMLMVYAFYYVTWGYFDSQCACRSC